MERWLGPYSEWIYGVARIVLGSLFATHGAQKLFAPGGSAESGNAMLIAAGTIEFIAGLLIALGLWAGYAAFIASGEMAVAYFTVHAAGGLSPVANKGELAVVYCFMFLFVAAKGSGRLSLDSFVPRVIEQTLTQPHVQRR